jgi:hypothetical protein
MNTTKNTFSASIPRFTVPSRPAIQVINMASAPEPDPRFRSLLGEAGWATLPENIRNRFGRKARAGCTVTYVGQIAECRMTKLGRTLAWAAKLIGAPLPLSTDTHVAAAVNVTEDESGAGQFWTRQYGHHNGFPQTINSTKRFSGPTGVEEHLGLGVLGVGIALTLRAEKNALYFESDHYFLKCFGLRLRFPKWLSPGHLTVGHIDGNDGWFAFSLDVTHPVFGNFIHQVCMFSERQ